MRKTAQTLLMILCTCAYTLLNAQLPNYAATKEKVYLHANHVFFSPGETVYFKLYVVNAADQKPAKLSGVVYVDVLNPSGNVLEKLNYKVENGYAEGSYEFGDRAVGGIYKLKAYTNWMQNEKDSSFFVKELTVQKIVTPRILMKLDFPQKGYGSGDEVVAKFSMRNLADQPIKNHKTKFTVSLSGTKFHTGSFNTDPEGKANIKFTLPSALSSTDGLLNITVDYDAYTESISRSIPITLNKIDLQFMPEGGTLVNGLSNRIAFKAVNEYGKPSDIKGEIIDDKGNKVAVFESFHFGMGKFTLIPQPGILYKARIISPTNTKEEYILPPAKETGIVMNVRKEEKSIQIKLTATEERVVKLIAKTKNIVHYSTNLVLKKGENDIEVPESLFPAGVAQFTAYTANDLPLAERLIFLNEHKKLQVTISTNKEKYLPREKVILTVKTMDENGKPLPSNLSLAVVDDKLWTLADDKQDHILSWLLLSSELRGKIEEPQFYFKKEEAKAQEALDLLMLTHGYRYFDYIEYVQKEQQLKFTPDQGNILNGMLVNSKGDPVKATLFLVHAVPGGKAIRINTEDDGLFFFSQLAPNTQYYLFAQAEGKKETVTIKILQNGIGYNLMKSLKYKALPSKSPDVIARQLAITKEEKDKKADNLVGFIPTIGKANAHLDEVVVIGYGTQRKKDVVGSIAVVNQRDILPINNLDFALQGRVAGVAITRQANPLDNPKIAIRGLRSISDGHQPLVVINGIPMEDFNLNTINPADIEYITVLKDAAAVALYGSRAAYGVIAIESKKYRPEKIRWHLSNTHSYTQQLIKTSGPAYSIAKRFYVPKYRSTETEERSDFRETVYWNSVIQTDKNGKAVVEFYNSDATTTFRAIAEGIAYNGQVGRTEKTYAAQTAMSIDAKIPPYLTVGDKARIPLVIKNNYSEALTIAIELKVPQHMTVGTYTSSLTLDPDSAKKILVPVEAIAGMKGNIQFTMTSQYGKETLLLPISAVEKGFPVIETFSGNSTKQHQFNINKMVPNSLKANLKLFRNLEGQLLDGIESMLREPYGCFEQTSSTTYPNIFVLKYLKESGKSNKEIEKKALDYIQRGYQRLIGFETSQDGFEWFGKTPPHEALTAYGLLEFTDMKEFINVDEQMLKRTKKFLLDRRDGQGGFKLTSGGYDRFASVPNKIANIYIVYALTEAGIGNEIKNEYRTAVQKALQSGDGYQLAMMALAASNMKSEKDYRLLMYELQKLYQSSDLPSETSVVNSSEGSLKVETLSLYALALMREQTPQAGVVANLISKILAQKCYYGYGSTQATVLALQAIVAYKKLVGKVAESDSIVFTINGQKVTEAEDMGTVLVEGNNTFTAQYNSERESIPYNLEVAYNTFTPPNAEKAEIRLTTKLSTQKAKPGETVRLAIEVTNTTSKPEPMTLAKIGIPAGLSLQPWQLKEIMEKNKVAYYEIFDNYLVFYWMGLGAKETKKLDLDLKADIEGNYKGKASNVYLYYTPEYKNWNEGLEIEIKE